MMRLLAIVFALPLAAAGPAAETARAIRENAFDREECYRVRDLTLVRHDIRIYLTDGYLIFSKPVMGRRVAAVFSADMEGGDGEVLLMPPNRGERRALASFIGTPNLNEHFRNAVFLSGGDLYGEFQRQMKENPFNRKLPEMGAALEDRWAGVLRNLSASHETRLTYDLLSGAAPGECLFTGIFGSVKRGNFDVVFDPRAAEQVTVGQVANREGRTFFDIWTSFESRSKSPRSSLFGRDAALTDYRIEASIEADLEMIAVTRVKVRPAQDGMRVIALDIAREMTVTSAKVDGREAEVMRRESLRGNLGRGGNEMFLVAPPEPLRAGREYEFEIGHRGRVIHDAGDRVYYVSARGNFYPTHGLQYATYDLRFRYARDLNLVSAGDVIEDSTEGEWRTTRRRTQAPVRMVGFNLGSYLSAKATKGGYTVEIFANRSLERALQPKQVMVPVEIPQVVTPRTRQTMPQFPSTELGPSPAMHLRKIAAEIADAMDFMAAKFGPPALPALTVSPIPGTFGQGFPGLLYLSTLTYLKGTASARARMTPHQEMFYSEVLQAHETAHQWWGNVVSAIGYHDHWLMEALANYSALLYLENRKGPRILTQALDHYRGELLEKNQAGKEVDSAGPIVLGTRLENSLEPRAWRAITYGKGSWIIHMLRRQMGDEPFFRMLAALRAKFNREEISTEDFRIFAAGFLPPKSDDPKLELFFDQWVYNTGVPALRMTHAVRGKAPAWKVSGTVTQSEVNDDFSVLVPVEVQMARGKSVVHWVRTSNEPEEFSISLRQAPLKVTLDPQGSMLRR